MYSTVELKILHPGHSLDRTKPIFLYPRHGLPDTADMVFCRSQVKGCPPVIVPQVHVDAGKVGPRKQNIKNMINKGNIIYYLSSIINPTTAILTLIIIIDEHYHNEMTNNHRHLHPHLSFESLSQ